MSNKIKGFILYVSQKIINDCVYKTSETNGCTFNPKGVVIRKLSW
jgi:hypothetical protein